MLSQPIFDLKNVSYTYEAINSPPFTALRDLNISIESGEFVAILGTSGSGKSTLMHLLGLMSDPTQGEFALSGVNLNLLSSNQKSEQRNQRIGFLFQQFFLLPQLTVLENILLPTEYFRGTTNSEIWLQKADQMLQKFGLLAHKNKRPSQLSGGQSQRAALCRALIMDPDILMCDEPTGALDSETAEEVLSTLVDLNEKGTTVIVITHDPEVARRAMRVIRIADGKIIDDNNAKPQKPTSKPKLIIDKKIPSHGGLNEVISRIKSNAIRSSKQLFIPTFQSLMTHRLRTTLTMTGLMLGVASVFIMLTLTGRVNLVFKEFFETQGSRKAFVSFDWRQAERTGAPQWRGLHTIEDLPKLNAQISNYGRIDAAIDTSGCKIISSQGNIQSSITGINSLQEAHENGLRLAAGRLPMPHEFLIEQPARIALLGSDAAQKLLPTISSIDPNIGQTLSNETVIIRGCEFEGIVKIVGILKPQDSLFDRDINSSIYMPASTLLAGGISPFNRRVVTVPNADINPTWFAKYVVNKLRIITSDKFPFRYFAAEQELEKFNMMMGILTGLTLVIGGLCTLIGGIGVMNIMLVNVHERLREIGIKKAVGARDADIRGQFLLESTGLCLISGVLGIGLGLATSSMALHLARSALPQVASLTMEFDFTALVTALAVSMGAGLIFGTWPARHAANLQIVDALRQE